MCVFCAFSDLRPPSFIKAFVSLRPMAYYWGSRGLKRAFLASPLTLLVSIRPPTRLDAPPSSSSDQPDPRATHEDTTGGSRKRWDSNWDFRANLSRKESATNNEREKQKAPTRYLYLVRHGQYVMTKGDENRVLSNVGKEQARMVGKWLSEANLPFTQITYSTMTRATETAKLMSSWLPNVPMEHCSMICEGAPIHPEPPHDTWNPLPHKFFTEGARIEAAFRQYFYRPGPEQKEDSHEIIVCHGNVIRYWTLRALQLPPEAWLRVALPNCSVTRITIHSDGRVSLTGLGEAAFMPHNLRTFN